METILKKHGLRDRVSIGYLYPKDTPLDKDKDIDKDKDRKGGVGGKEEIGEEEQKKAELKRKAELREKVFEYYRAKIWKGNKQRKMNDTRKRLIDKRVNENYTWEEIKRAIDNFSQDDYERRDEFNDIVYCFGIRNGEDKFEKWLNKPNKPRKGSIEEIYARQDERLAREKAAGQPVWPPPGEIKQ